MKKALNISIANTLYYIEEDAYDKLSAYLGSVRSHFAAYPDQEEIVADIESRIAEQFSAKDKKIITIQDVDELVKVMGEASQFGDGADEAVQVEQQEKKRLYRNPDDRIIAGVCSGIAAYLGIDPTIVRIVLLISLFFGGTGLLVYVVLWIVMPEAKTPTEKLQMRGNPVTLESVSEMVKEKADEVRHTAESGSFRRLLEIPGAFIRGAGEFLSRGVFPVIGKILGALLAAAASVAIVGLSIAFFSVLFNYPSPNINFPLGEVVRGPLYIALLVSSYVALAVPAAFFLLVGIGMIRRKSQFEPRYSFPILGMWLVSIVVLGVAGVRTSALYAEFVRTDPSYQRAERQFEIGEFSKISVENGQNVVFIQASTTSAIVEGRQRDLDFTDVAVIDGVLTVRRLDDPRICILCFRNSPQITVSAPFIEEVSLANGSTLEAADVSIEALKLNVRNGSHAAAKGRIKALEIDIRNTSSVSVEGAGQTLRVRALNGSRLNARSFEANDVAAEAENGSRIEVFPLEDLTAVASNGSWVRYVGTPANPVNEQAHNGSIIESLHSPAPVRMSEPDFEF